MVKEELQKYIDQEAQLEGALSAIQQYAGTNSKEEIGARVAIGEIATRYHPHPGLEFYAEKDSGFAMAAGRSLTTDTQSGMIKTAKTNLEATLGLLSERDLVGIATDIITPSAKKDEKHDTHRAYLKVRDELITEKGVNIGKYLEPFNDDSAYSTFIKRIASQEAETKDGKKVRVATQLGEELVKDFVNGYKIEFLGKFADKGGKKTDSKDLSKYADGNLKDLPEEEPEEVQLKNSIIYTIVKTAVKPTEPEEDKKEKK